MTTRNELQSFEEEFIKRIRENDAWKKLSASSELPWSEKLLEQYADQWDWTELSQNKAITWTAEMIDKFQARIDWNELTESITACRYNDSRPTHWDIIKRFESKWDWKTISRNASHITPEVIEQFIDKWDWKELIENREINWNFKLFERFKRYIPIADFSHFKQSTLWDKLVEIEERIITGKILAEN
jgi:hypothetical protein